MYVLLPFGEIPMYVLLPFGEKMPQADEGWVLAMKWIEGRFAAAMSPAWPFIPALSPQGRGGRQGSARCPARPAPCG